MSKTYTEQLEQATYELLKELLPLHVGAQKKAASVGIYELDVHAADVKRLVRMRGLASEFSQACARRAAEILDREVEEQ